MPWKVKDVMEQRIELVVRALQKERTMGELCEEYGISRVTVSGATSKAASDSVVISSELDSFQSLVKPSVERLYGLLPGAGVLYAREEGIG